MLDVRPQDRCSFCCRKSRLLDAAPRRSEVRCVSRVSLVVPLCRCSRPFPPLALSCVRTNVNAQEKVRARSHRIYCATLCHTLCALQSDGWTPLHEAVGQKKIACIKALVTHPNIDLTVDKVRRSALICFPRLFFFCSFCASKSPRWALCVFWVRVLRRAAPRRSLRRWRRAAMSLKSFCRSIPRPSPAQR